jgi:nucleoside-diphosphate-sugar epimerase
MEALVIGGTGLIGAGIVKHLVLRGARVTTYDRGRRAHTLGPEVKQLLGDRRDAASFERAFHGSRFDVVIDMACFTPEEAESAVRAFGGRCEHFQFCSTVCTYGVEVPRGVLVDEDFPQRPITTYGKNKVLCERIFRRASEDERFQVTIFRPSHTYGPGSPLIDQLEGDGVAWDRVERGLPVLCAGDGLGLWQPTHRDDCGKLFASAALNPKTYSEAYNATGDEIFTWREYYRVAARALGTRARLVFVPAAWLIAQLPERFGLLAEITQFHGAYSSAKAVRHVPEFRSSIDFETGARETFADIRRRGAWRDGATDHAYQRLVDTALDMGMPIEGEP